MNRWANVDCPYATYYRVFAKWRRWIVLFFRIVYDPSPPQAALGPAFHAGFFVADLPILYG